MSNILIISPESWEDHSVSKHHYAMTLAHMGHQIYFLNPPDDTLKTIKLEASEVSPNLTIVHSPKVVPGLRFLPRILRNKVESKWLNKLEKIIGGKLDIVWLFENSRFYDMRFAGSRIKIYHQVDLNQDLHPEVAASTADICFVVSDVIKDTIVEHNRHAHKITHGTSYPEAIIPLSNKELLQMTPGSIHAVYVGNLNISCLDVTLLSKLVKDFPHVTFHFVGGYSKTAQAWKQLSGFKNVVWWGRVKSNKIPSILKNADILLVTYKTEQWEYVANPHKFMEYFASGKVIVSTYTDEYKDKRYLLEMTDKNTDYEIIFRKVLSNLDSYNDEEKQAKRKAFAESNSYENQVRKAFQYIDKLGGQTEGYDRGYEKRDVA